MFQLDLKSGVPICNQIVNGFIRLKALRLVRSGEPLPSVRALASKFSINPNTVQKAYSILEASGVVFSVKGKGSFFSDDESATFGILENASQEFKSSVLEAKNLGLSKAQLVEIINSLYETEE